MQPLSLYIHWPFCLSKCPYCDFNSHVGTHIDLKKWQQAYIQSLKFWAHKTQGRQIRTVYFGGGTPSLMPPMMIQRILENVHSLWGVASDCEITLEANPNSSDVSRFQEFAQAGINRLSLGVQSLRTGALQFLGRKHSVSEAKKAIQNARSVFERYTFDLIYARPHQSSQEWQEELCEALDLARGHMSLYQLTIEPNTAFATRFYRGEIAMPDEECSAQFYEATNNTMHHAGFDAYEVSNYCKPGQESQHNLCYWRYEDYVGIGPGAHGRITLGGQKYATITHRAPQIWLDAALDEQNFLKEMNPISNKEQLDEFLLMGMRLQQGISRARLETYLNWDHFVNTIVKDYVYSEGYVEVSGDIVRATPKGRMVLNRVIEHISSAI